MYGGFALYGRFPEANLMDLVPRGSLSQCDAGERIGNIGISRCDLLSINHFANGHRCRSKLRPFTRKGNGKFVGFLSSREGY